MKLKAPLKGTTVVDFSRLIPGPFCTKILSDLGATIIKIEDAKRGDYLSSFPPYVFDNEAFLSVYFNKNKMRLKLDFTKSEGKDIIVKLVQKADVLLESFRPGAMKKWGLDAKNLHRKNPRLIYASLTGFNNDSQQPQPAGHDLNFMATSGFLEHFLKDQPKSETGFPPPSYLFADFVGGGLFCALQILAALNQKKRKNVVIKHSMVAALTYLNAHHSHPDLDALLTPINGTLARYRVYTSSDDVPVALGALEDKFWFAFCDQIQRPDLKDIGFDVDKNRQAQKDVQKVIASQSSSYWQAWSQKNDVCLSALSKPKMTMKTIRCGNDKISLAESDFLNQKRVEKYHKAGLDTETILRKIGYTTKKTAELKKKGIIT